MMNTIINPSSTPTVPIKKPTVDVSPSSTSSRGLTPKDIGSLTPGGDNPLSRSELSSIAGSIASKLDQYISTTTNTSHNQYASSEGNSVTGNSEEDDVALANSLQAISVAAQKISDNIYKEPKKTKKAHDGHQVTAENFESEKHFYPRVLNAQIHPMVGYFFSLGNERIIARFMHLNPQINEEVLRKCLGYVPKHFQWAGMFTLPCC